MSFITAIGTATPSHRFSQSVIADFMVRAMQLDESAANKLRALYRATGIESRYSVLPDYGKSGDYEFYANSADLTPMPSTKKRLELFRKHAVELSRASVLDALNGITDIDRKDITHLIVVSCTGLYAPGLDIDLIKDLGLRPDVQRTCVNFMGCYAAFNALKLADSFCGNSADAKVLIVCTELCSLHFQKENTQDNMLANALFGDGSATILVEGRPRKGLNLKPEIFRCDIAMNGEDDMAWTVGDVGFEMKLSAYVPDIIQTGIRDLTSRLLDGISKNMSDVTYFAIHPGGKRILEVIEKELGLTRAQNVYAYNVLKKYGNMSSPTVVFVLKELCGNLNGVDHNKKILCFAFGPGLTMESMLLSVVNA
ncbi:MAG TPA: type III polyketide synthase [Cyclobacteriaceae bacterium]|nr:type III polyketide synthase [Cyclobacteriaceae bacterium]